MTPDLSYYLFTFVVTEEQTDLGLSFDVSYNVNKYNLQKIITVQSVALPQCGNA
jgi:hypothetical protein